MNKLYIKGLVTVPSKINLQLLLLPFQSTSFDEGATKQDMLESRRRGTIRTSNWKGLGADWINPWRKCQEHDAFVHSQRILSEYSPFEMDDATDLNGGTQNTKQTGFSLGKNTWPGNSYSPRRVFFQQNIRNITIKQVLSGILSKTTAGFFSAQGCIFQCKGCFQNVLFFFFTDTGSNFVSEDLYTASHSY